MRMNQSAASDVYSGQKSTLCGFGSEADCIASIAKTASKKIGPLIFSIKFLSSNIVPYLYNLPSCVAWNIVMPGLT